MMHRWFRATAMIAVCLGLGSGCQLLLGLEEGSPANGAPDAGVDAPEPDAMIDVCSLPIGVVCDPINQTGCQAGQKCSSRIVTDQMSPNTTECVPTGTVAVGDACAFAADTCAGGEGTEYDDCIAGSFCSAGVCKTICEAAPDTCGDGSTEACVRVGGAFDDIATLTGLCFAQCDGNQDDTCAAAEGCYPLSYSGFTEFDFVCAFVPAEAQPLLAGEPCAPTSGGACFVNSAPKGATVVVLDPHAQQFDAVVGPYCRPINTSVDEPQENADGVDGATDNAGNTVECAAGNLQSGGQIGGAGPQFGCRDMGSLFGDVTTNPIGGDAANYVGVCVPQRGGDVGGNWIDSTIWNPQDLVDDIADGQIDDPERSLCFGCLDHETFDALVGNLLQTGRVTKRAFAPRRTVFPTTVYDPRR